MLHRLISKEKSVLSYKSYNINAHDDKDIGLWLEVCKPSTSTWWSTLPNIKSRHDISKIFKEMFKDKKNIASVLPDATTMKGCPGVLGLFKSTVLLKAPMDMEIHLKDNENENGPTTQIISKSTYSSMLPIESHPTWQFANSGSTWANYRNIKFKFPFIISSTHPYIFVQPYWHNPLPFDVPPGGLFGEYYKHEALNLNTFFKMNGNKEYETFKIKKGTIMAYMVFPYPVSLKYDAKLHIDPRITMLKNGSVS